MNINKTSSITYQAGHDRPLFERSTDAYSVKGKLVEPTVCPECNAVFNNERWQWVTVPERAERKLCPACHRIKDNLPAGYVTLEGQFYKDHIGEIQRLIQHHVEHERNEHPLKRFIEIENENASMLVTTTDTHLARGIGEALHHAYQGKLRVDHVSSESLVHVYWNR